MSMFATNRGDHAGRAPARHETGLSILAAGARFVGQIQADGVVKIEGEVEGSIRAEGRVLVARGGVVRGDIATRQAVIAGEVHGGVEAEERVELQPTSSVEGDITAPRIVVEEGGKVNGHIRMAAPQGAGQSSADVRAGGNGREARAEGASGGRPAVAGRSGVVERTGPAGGAVRAGAAP